MQRKKIALKAGCAVTTVILVAGVILTLISVKRMGVMMGDPLLYVSRPSTPGADHEAWFLDEGFRGREWYFFVKSSGAAEPICVKDIVFGSFDLSGAEWSSDGQVIVMSSNATGTRVFGYDFSTNKAFVSPMFKGLDAVFEYKFIQGQQKIELHAKLEPWASELGALLDAHGGADTELITPEFMRQNGRRLTYAEFRPLMTLLGRDL